MKHTPDTECESVAGEEIQKNSAVYRADDGKIYKSLTYPNTFSEVVEYLLERKDVLAMATKEDAKDVLTYQIGKAISSRDTYWKNHEHDMYETLEKENREQTIIDIARVRDERDTYWKEMVRSLMDYIEHDNQCIISQAHRGRPTNDGGYETQYGDKWYRSPDKPECDCGLDTLLDNLK